MQPSGLFKPLSRFQTITPVPHHSMKSSYTGERLSGTPGNRSMFNPVFLSYGTLYTKDVLWSIYKMSYGTGSHVYAL